MPGWRTLVGTLALGTLLGGWRSGHAPPAVVAAYGALSAAAYLLYRRDKGAAQTGARRTPERTLHIVALLGGWPGSLLAQDLHRHKHRKVRFQLLFWLTVVANCAALAWALGERAPGVPPYPR